MRCPKCGMSVRDVNQRGCSECGLAPGVVTLQLRFDSLVKAGETNWISWRLRVAAGGNHRINAEWEITSPDLVLEGPPAGRDTIAVGGVSHTRSLKIAPPRPGSYRLDFHVHVDDVWISACQIILKAESPTAPSQSLVVQGRQATEQAMNVGNDTFNIVVGSEPAPPFRLGKFSSIPLELLLPPEIIVNSRLRLDLPTGRVLNLIGVVDGCAALGRDKNQDVVLRESDDELSTDISRRHARIRFNSSGPVWAQLPSRNGTQCNGRQLDTVPYDPDSQLTDEQLNDLETPHLLQEGTKYTLADTKLVPKFYREPLRQEVRRSYSLHCLRYNSIFDDNQCPVTSILLKVEDDLGVPSEFLLVPQSIKVGSETNCALEVSGDHVERSHARIAFLAGQFWVEPSASGAAVSVGGVSVPFGSRRQLVADSTLRIGDVDIHVDPFRIES